MLVRSWVAMLVSPHSCALRMKGAASYRIIQAMSGCLSACRQKPRSKSPAAGAQSTVETGGSQGGEDVLRRRCDSSTRPLQEARVRPHELDPPVANVGHELDYAGDGSALVVDAFTMHDPSGEQRSFRELETITPSGLGPLVANPPAVPEFSRARANRAPAPAGFFIVMSSAARSVAVSASRIRRSRAWASGTIF